MDDIKLTKEAIELLVRSWQIARESGYVVSDDLVMTRQGVILAVLSHLLGFENVDQIVGISRAVEDELLKFEKSQLRSRKSYLN